MEEENGSLTCDICQKVCTTKSNRKMHMKVVHYEKSTIAPKHSCETCGKKYVQKQALTRHTMEY